MKVLTNDRNLVVSLERGDRLVESLTRVARDGDFTSATFSGIGSVTDVTLGYYDVSEEAYVKRHFPDTYELVSCLGNISMKEESPFVHAHVAISGRDYRPHSGHLFEATVAVVGELAIWPLGAEIQRTENRELGLAIWNLEECNHVQ
ncbi:MAG: PPC domain-containing DNA-binding protein [Fidelibacterota bacterium]